MLTYDSILPYVLSRLSWNRAEGNILRHRVEVPPLRSPVGPQDQTRAEAVPGVQESVLESPSGQAPERAPEPVGRENGGCHR